MGRRTRSAAGTERCPGIERECHFLDVRYIEFAEGVTAATIADLRVREKGDPSWKYGVSGRYRLPLDRQIGDVSVQAGWNWQAQFTLGSASFGTIEVPAYGLLNLAINWDHVARSAMDASLFMSNATNKEYLIGGLSGSNALGFSNGIYGEPRMYGARVRWRFGAE